jgi:hypothetical protein
LMYCYMGEGMGMEQVTLNGICLAAVAALGLKFRIDDGVSVRVSSDAPELVSEVLR